MKNLRLLSFKKLRTTSEVYSDWLLRYPCFKIKLKKLACLHLNDYHQIDVDYHLLSSPCPHEYWIFETLFYEFFFLVSYCSGNKFDCG